MVLAWLLRTMQFRLMHYVRDHRAELEGNEEAIPVEDLKASSSAPPLSRMARDELRGALLGLIETLPEAERRVVVLLYRERRTTAEIAAELGRSEGAVRALHQRAVRRLRERLGDRRQ
jgi:RNA polymerase sigma-70 factor (ECF subfamily)